MRRSALPTSVPAPTAFLLLTPESPELRSAVVPPADVIVLDVQTSGRRGAALAWLSSRTVTSPPVWLRLHAMGSDQLTADLVAFGDMADGIVLSGVRRSADLDRVATHTGRTPLIPVVDSAAALLCAPSLARHRRVGRLGFTSLAAAGDLTDDMLCPQNTAAWVHRHIAAASAAARLPGPVGGLHPRPLDEDELRHEARTAHRAGFTGFCTSTVRQVDAVREVFQGGAARPVASAVTGA
ncbi:hypothetical protein AB0D49_40680 [Streptomyces sp. NPDC048290]|uniref:hypothetical protein n=1 Tax=Streptomyces sp. NPDC048290 TaxID=3155811 RepID=UPI0034374F07